MRRADRCFAGTRTATGGRGPALHRSARTRREVLCFTHTIADRFGDYQPHECVAASQRGMTPTSGPLHIETSGTGPPLVMLHGWAMHGGLFASLVPALARRYQVAVVDLPGHGFSATVEPYTIDAVVDALAQRFGRETQPLTVLGWSLGGMIAMRWARSHPARVSRLILVSTTPRFVAAADWPHAMAAATLARFGDELRAAYRPALLRFLALQVQGGDAGRAALAELRRAMFARGEPMEAAMAAALSLLASTDLRTEVGAIETPALIVSGDRDTLTPSGASRWLADALPDARHIEINGAAHAPFLSHRAAFDAALLTLTDAR